jgi:steroid 5-alpha reductase family enzyme
MKGKNILLLAFCIVICHLAGIIGSFFTVSSLDSWYSVLQKPFFQPPNFLFGPVWLTLYTLMGIALYLVWKKGFEQKIVKQAVIVFLIHLVLNALWSIFFFGWQNIILAFADIVFLWSLIVFLIFIFKEINKVAAWLLVPYLLWVSFAAILNLSLWKLNIPWQLTYDHFLLIGLGVVVYMTILFVVSQLRQRNDIADVGWGVGFFMIALFGMWSQDFANAKMNFLGLLISLWGLRLAIHIFIRNRGKKEDFRYLQWRQEWGECFLIRSYLQVFLLQGLLMYVIGFSIIVMAAWGKDQFCYLEILGIMMWSIGFFFEAVSDWQLQKFISDQQNKGKIMQTGLWQYSRHPNYFGEVTQWWGIFLMVANVPYGFFTIISPLAITFLILKVSGIPMLERKYEGNLEFADYQKRTNAFSPWIPQR